MEYTARMNEHALVSRAAAAGSCVLLKNVANTLPFAGTLDAPVRVAVFGIGGVGGYTVEALARSGVGALDLIDDDRVCLTNVNRQILATRETVGKCKVDAAEARIRTINPNCQVTTYKTFFLPGEESQFDFTQYDYVIDAIDTVSGKMGLVLAAKQASVPIISAMGAGNKVDPTAFRVADIYETSVCPLARVMRRLCKERNIPALKVVYSTEPPVIRSREPASVSFVPSVCGLVMAGALIKDLCFVGGGDGA